MLLALIKQKHNFYLTQRIFVLLIKEDAFPTSFLSIELNHCDANIYSVVQENKH